MSDCGPKQTFQRDAGRFGPALFVAVWRGATMRLYIVVVFALIAGVSSSMSGAFARSAPDCSTSGTLVDWGQNSTGYIDLKSGGSCLFPIRKPGVSGSDISQKPVHGRLKKLNITTYEYTAKARYRGADTFAIKATGQGQTASGTSVITVHATIK